MTTPNDTDMLSRRLHVNGTLNLRDIGGYSTLNGHATVWRKILRGDALHQIDDKGREVLASYELKTSLDLRENDERTVAPDRLGDDVRLVSIPLFAYAVQPDIVPHYRRESTTLDDVYQYVVAERGAELAAAFRELARPGGLPAIVHCTAGKDRTGIVIGLLLSLLGVPDEVIAADFVATSLFLTEEFYATLTQYAVDAGQDPTEFAAMLDCSPELILNVLDQVRTSHGDIENYLLYHGLTSEEIEQLRSHLLEVEEKHPSLEHSTQLQGVIHD